MSWYPALLETAAGEIVAEESPEQQAEALGAAAAQAAAGVNVVTRTVHNDSAASAILGGRTGSQSGGGRLPRPRRLRGPAYRIGFFPGGRATRRARSWWCVRNRPESPADRLRRSSASAALAGVPKCQRRHGTLLSAHDCPGLAAGFGSFPSMAGAAGSRRRRARSGCRRARTGRDRGVGRPLLALRDDDGQWARRLLPAHGDRPDVDGSERAESVMPAMTTKVGTAGPSLGPRRRTACSCCVTSGSTRAVSRCAGQ